MALSYGETSSIEVVMEGPFGSGGISVKVTEVTIPAAGWKGAESPYSQEVTIDGVSMNSKVDLQPSAEQVEMLRDAEVALTTENNSGVVTVYAIGNKPTEDYTIQASITEVVA